MKFSIQDIDRRLETFFETNLLSIFNKHPLILLTEDLVREFEKNIKKSNGKIIAPDHFLIKILKEDFFHNNDLEEWELFAYQLLTEIAEDNSFSFSSPLKIEVTIDKTLKDNLKVTAEISSPTSGDTINLSKEITGKGKHANTLSAFLILWDEDVFEIKNNITNIGRQAGNDIVIDNLRVSRIHAQIRKIKNGLFIFDASSTCGTRVNGQTIKQHQLSNGDVIEIADVPLIISIGEKLDEINIQGPRTKLLIIKEMKEEK